MYNVQRSVIVAYSAAQMFDLVADVGQYPVFMPWCADANVLSHDAQGMLASLTISFVGVKQQFTTRNTHDFPHRIDLKLVKGPFSTLDGVWAFKALTPQACEVSLTLEYAFSQRLLKAVVGPVFNSIASSLIDSFITRAQAVYGA